MSQWKWLISDIFYNTICTRSELIYFTPDIILSFFIVVQGICFIRNVLFIAMFWDFMNKTVYIALQEIDEFWGEALWKSIKQLLFFN